MKKSTVTFVISCLCLVLISTSVLADVNNNSASTSTTNSAQATINSHHVWHKKHKKIIKKPVHRPQSSTGKVCLSCIG